MFKKGTQQQAVWDFMSKLEVGDMEEFTVVDPSRGIVMTNASARATICSVSRVAGVKFRTFTAPTKMEGRPKDALGLWVVRIK